MPMNVFEACFLINKARGEALVVSTMSAMFAAAAIGPGPHNLSSVPLMGGASGLGLGLALSQPGRKVLVLDGDASLLMELGTMATIGQQAPANLVHFVFNNGVQFAGLANMARPGGAQFDFVKMGEAAGYASSRRIDSLPELMAAAPALLGTPGPHFVELMIAPQPRLLTEMPQPELPDAQFHRMGAEARSMMQLLGVTA